MACLFKCKCKCKDPVTLRESIMRGIDTCTQLITWWRGGYNTTKGFQSGVEEIKELLEHLVILKKELEPLEKKKEEGL